MAEALAAAERAEKTAAARSEGGNGSKGSRARESHGRAETIRGSRAGPEPAPLSDFTQPEPPGRGDAGGKSGAVQGLEARLSQLQLPPSPGGGGEGGSGAKGPGDAVGGAPAAEGVEGRWGAPRGGGSGGGWQERRIAELEALVQQQAEPPPPLYPY